MSASAPHQMSDDSTPPRTAAVRALRPYAGPAAGHVASDTVSRIAPYIPAAWRVNTAPQAAGAVAVATPDPIVAERVPTPSLGFAPVMRTPTRVTPIAVRALTPLSIESIDSLPSEPAPSELLADVTASNELPWIDAFLASTPPTPMEAIAEIGASADEVGVAEVLADHAEDSVVEGSIGAGLLDVHSELHSELHSGLHAEAPVDDVADEELSAHVVSETLEDIAAVTEEWPLDEAAADFEDLSHRIDAEHGPEAASLFDEPTAPPHGLSPWSDEDFMDIMPVRRSHRTPLSSPSIDSVTWADRARAAQAARDAESPQGVGRAIDAADALEMLARRVRAGELAVPEFDSRMGEPAALVAALAAVLGVRLR